MGHKILMLNDDHETRDLLILFYFYYYLFILLLYSVPIYGVLNHTACVPSNSAAPVNNCSKTAAASNALTDDGVTFARKLCILKSRIVKEGLLPRLMV